MDQEPMLLHQLLMSDEANFFWVGSSTNKISDTGLVKIHEFFTRNHRRARKLWCGVQWVCVGLLALTLLRMVLGRALTVSADRYVDMLQNFLVPELHARQLDNIWFQQDGATPHTARLSSEICSPIVWSPASAIWLGHLAPQV
jgi:hypothetical protein